MREAQPVAADHPARPAHRTSLNAPTQANDTMQQLLDHPMVQAGVAPLVVALLVAAALWRTRLAWLAVVAGFATAASLSAGISVSPLTAGRKVTLLVLLSPLVGLVLDRLAGRAPRWLPWAASAGCGLSTLWVFASLLGQREGTALVTTAVGLASFASAAMLSMVRTTGPVSPRIGSELSIATVSTPGTPLSSVRVASTAARTWPASACACRSTSGVCSGSCAVRRSACSPSGRT